MERALIVKLYKNGWTDLFTVGVVDSGRPKEAEIQVYSPGSANVHKFSRFRFRLVAPMCRMTLCRELCRNGWTIWFAVWVVDSGRPREPQVQLYSPGGAIVLSWECTLAPPGKYDWTIRLQWRCGLMSDYFDHLFLLLLDLTRWFYSCVTAYTVVTTVFFLFDTLCNKYNKTTATS